MATPRKRKKTVLTLGDQKPRIVRIKRALVLKAQINGEGDEYNIIAYRDSDVEEVKEK